MSDDMRKLNRYRHLKTLLLSILSFLLGCALTISLTPIDKTCRLENTDHGYNIMSNSQLPNPELMILILSSPKNQNKRNIIRETWLKLLDNSSNHFVRFKMKHYFVIGSFGLTKDDILHLSTEQSINSDILILPMYDSYQNLTEKVLRSFHWLNEQHDLGFDYKYLLKCDDDSFVRIDKILEELAIIETYLKQQTDELKPNPAYTSFNTQTNRISTDLELYWGYFNGNAKIKTRGKWKETEWIACDRYIPYALGGGYILTRNLVSILANNAANYRRFNSEDISVGFYLAPIAPILRLHDIRFDTEWTTRGCQNYYLITHNIPIDEMKKMYENLQKTGRLCDREIIKRDYYLYDWKSPPSQCCNNLNN